MVDSTGATIGTVTFGVTNMTLVPPGGGGGNTYGHVGGTQWVYESPALQTRWVFNAGRTAWEVFDTSVTPPKSMGSGTVK